MHAYSRELLTEFLGSCGATLGAGIFQKGKEGYEFPYQGARVRPSGGLIKLRILCYWAGDRRGSRRMLKEPPYKAGCCMISEDSTTPDKNDDPITASIGSRDFHHHIYIDIYIYIHVYTYEGILSAVQSGTIEKSDIPPPGPKFWPMN